TQLHLHCVEAAVPQPRLHGARLTGESPSLRGRTVKAQLRGHQRHRYHCRDADRDADISSDPTSTNQCADGSSTDGNTNGSPPDGNADGSSTDGNTNGNPTDGN